MGDVFEDGWEYENQADMEAAGWSLPTPGGILGPDWITKAITEHTGLVVTYHDLDEWAWIIQNYPVRYG